MRLFPPLSANSLFFPFGCGRRIIPGVTRLVLSLYLPFNMFALETLVCRKGVVFIDGTIVCYPQARDWKLGYWGQEGDINLDSCWAFLWPCQPSIFGRRCTIGQPSGTSLPRFLFLFGVCFFCWSYILDTESNLYWEEPHLSTRSAG